jgi:glycosyltransferase involved in cell wall biosynthesis
MSAPLVSIMMPVYNSMSYARSNGHMLLPLAIDSLLQQTHSNLELIILDNQSTDQTPQICEAYAQKDSRIRYIVDDRPRNPHEASSKLATLTRGKYSVYAGDDDLWNPTYIEKMVSFLEANPDVAMAYSNGHWINLEGNAISEPILQEQDMYRMSDTSLYSFCTYTYRRRVVPIIFGVYRTHILNRLLPFETFDLTIANVDNLFICKFFLQEKCQCIGENLFFYRRKHRYADPKGITDLPSSEFPLLIWLYYVRHQLWFAKKVHELLPLATFSKDERGLAECAIFDSFLSNAVNLLGWIQDDYVSKDARHLPAYNDFIQLIRSPSFELLRKSLVPAILPSIRQSVNHFQLLPDVPSLSVQKAKKCLELILHVEKNHPNSDQPQLFLDVRSLLKEEVVRFSRLQQLQPVV